MPITPYYYLPSQLNGDELRSKPSQRTQLRIHLSTMSSASSLSIPRTLTGFYVFSRVDSDAEGEWRKNGSSASGLLACDTAVCWAEYESSLGTLLGKLRGVIDTHFLVHDPCSLTPNAPRLGCEAISACGFSLYVLQSLKKTACNLGRVLCVLQGSF